MSIMEHSKDDSLNLFIVLSRASQWVNAHADRDIRSHGLNRTEFGVLELFITRGHSPSSKLAAKFS